MIEKVTVSYNKKVVGYLKPLKDNRIAFQYDESWLKDGFSISPFSLPLNSKIFISNSPHFEGLFGVFYDSLPNGWGELVIRKSLRNIGINYDKLNVLEKLSYINDSGLGALKYEPSFKIEENNNNNIDSLYEIIRKIFKSAYNSNELSTIYNVSGSSTGSRPKVFLKIDNEDWIVKFPREYESLDAGKEEFKANELAKKCEINVNEFKLINNKYFASKRFDRDGDKRIHMITLSSILETSYRIPNLDYFHLFKVVSLICKDKDSLYEVFKRMCFNFYYENKDDHGANFSFIYNEKEKTYELSPFYDITKTKDKLEHEMSINSKGNPTEEDLLTIASKFNLELNKCKKIMNNIKNAIIIF